MRGKAADVLGYKEIAERLGRSLPPVDHQLRCARDMLGAGKTKRLMALLSGGDQELHGQYSCILNKSMPLTKIESAVAEK